jgi:hypothetical protein
MRRQTSATSTAIGRFRTWPSISAKIDVLTFGAAMGLIAAIVLTAPQLRLP